MKCYSFYFVWLRIMIKLFIFESNRNYFLQLFLCITYICQTWSNLRRDVTEIVKSDRSTFEGHLYYCFWQLLMCLSVLNHVNFCNFTRILQMILWMAQKEYEIKLLIRELVRKIIDIVSFPHELKWLRLYSMKMLSCCFFGIWALLNATACTVINLGIYFCN